MVPKKRWLEYLLNISPSIWAVACLLLAVLLGVFAVSNYQREKELLTGGIVQRGLTLIRFINSSVRRSVQSDLASGSFQVELWGAHMTEALAEVIEHPGVDFILIVDSGGNVLSSGGQAPTAAAINKILRAFGEGAEQKIGPEDLRSRIATDPVTKKKKFQMVVEYGLPPMLRGPMHNGPMMREGRQRGRFSRNHQPDSMELAFTELVQKQPRYIIQLDFAQFSSPLNRQLAQIAILVLVLMLVATGGILSLMTLRGLRGSQVRIGKMQAFTDILVSSLPVGLIATDNSGTIQICNEAAEGLLGISEEQVRGKMVQDSLVTEVARRFSVMESGTRERLSDEIELQDEGGMKKSLHLASKSVYGRDGSFAGAVMLIRDLTELKTLEKELQRSERMAALGKMAAGVAHELRNPLSSIKGLALLLNSMVSGSDKGLEASEMLVREVERLNRSIGELLDYAKPESLDLEVASIVPLLEKVKSLIEIDARAYGVDIELDISPELPPVRLDRDKMNQLFLNLFLNAIQAMPEGGRLVVRTGSDNMHLFIDVQDNGVGIRQDHLAKIMDPYFTTKSDGTGLGLSMSNKIVEEHGGRLEVTSREGEFTNVRVVLPVAPA
jgi:two-component system sensor histidine kinase HydH